jgi:hypothetical protein
MRFLTGGMKTVSHSAVALALLAPMHAGAAMGGDRASLGGAPDATLVRYYSPGATPGGTAPESVRAPRPLSPPHTLKDLKPGYGPQDTKRIPGGPEEGVSGGGASGEGGGGGWAGGGAGRELPGH